jgi:hypothetical protein
VSGFRCQHTNDRKRMTEVVFQDSVFIKSSSSSYSSSKNYRIVHRELRLFDYEEKNEDESVKFVFGIFGMIKHGVRRIQKLVTRS